MKHASFIWALVLAAACWLVPQAEAALSVYVSPERLAELEARIVELHPYDVPEFVSVSPSSVEARYLTWWLGATDAGAGPDEPS